MFQQDEMMIAIVATALVVKEQKRKAAENAKNAPRKHRFWVHKLWQGWPQLGAYHTLVQELSLDEEKFKEFFRLRRTQFIRVLACVEQDLSKCSRVREVISSRQLLAVTIR